MIKASLMAALAVLAISSVNATTAVDTTATKSTTEGTVDQASAQVVEGEVAGTKTEEGKPAEAAK